MRIFIIADLTNHKGTIVKVMKKIFFFLFSFIFFSSIQAQTYQGGEWLKFRIHYGWFNASFATLEVKKITIGNTPVYHIIGKGKSTGLLNVFYEIDDRYESFINAQTQLPYKFVRDINEGGYTKNKIIYYNQKKHTAKVRDLKHHTLKSYSTRAQVQDMLSALYYIRNQIDGKLKEKGDSIVVNMFFDNQNYKFKTVYLGTEIIKSEFGKVKCLKLRPYVQAGRVFKKQESLTVWVSADKNKIPIKIEAKLSVGSLTADLYAYKNLKNPFVITMK